ncbi:hypothetical protein Tco_0429297 [Tanacetum coccineum]
MVDVEEPPFSDPGALQRGYKSSSRVNPFRNTHTNYSTGDNRASLVDETLLDKGQLHGYHVSVLRRSPIMQSMWDRAVPS